MSQTQADRSSSLSNTVVMVELGQNTYFQAQEDEYLESTDENLVRGNWSLKTDYVLSVVGFTVGLGNLWRFPYLVYKNGGGAFLIPYTIMMAIAGVPLVFLETALGQFASLGPLAVWKVVPILQGLGILSFILSVLQSIYYSIIISYSLFYLFSSFQYPLPWDNCSSWSDKNVSCYKIIQNKTCANRITTKSASEIYWDEKVLRRSPSISHTGNLNWDLALCLLLAWLIVFVAVSKGIKSSGKVVYFTVTFPYFGLILLLIRGVTLTGANKGIEFYMGNQSDFSKLADAEVWKDAATQTFYSLSVTLGGLIALSSYNKFHNDCCTDAISICIIDGLTSMFAGFAIFAILGHLSYDTNMPVSEVTHSGFGLAFVVCPEALRHLPISPLWSVIFFCTIIALGFSSQSVLVEVIITCLQDEFPFLLREKRLYLTATVCLVLYLSGVFFETQAGIYWLNLIDTFCFGWGLLLMALLELIGICWIYGVNRFIGDIEMMNGKKSFFFWIWWKVCWALITPVILTVVLAWSINSFTSLKYASIDYPKWATILGWLMIAFCLMWIPLIAILEITAAEGGNIYQRVLTCLKPTSDWGPYLKEHRGQRYENQTDPSLFQLHSLSEKDD
ncbi:sodium- and chloride-dependent neutral and basic amino acid transporter B(0+)-like [Mobula birostris]|uniref:sodium- and chloride-dependent neutral and basic amino acid transporter B(0+)-like n=1 Tax=Mobula birostris TaxID=1983395 RepID=UPI003B27BEEC